MMPSHLVESVSGFELVKIFDLIVIIHQYEGRS
ncbi:hypothetical protein VII00023_06542 [Vibrio ichthyoenteri ATCC 700023]|uniref:Uncharacterized protein n=1 Tax=Vibrio ichthyoenteri ATCC 700023 TaxID=870968 RepID=F9S6M0_9VIBR|nr:hypothetical protein VII00023_06542 [Vibrio ichthyoenteri ATCC 700023]